MSICNMNLNVVRLSFVCRKLAAAYGAAVVGAATAAWQSPCDDVLGSVHVHKRNRLNECLDMRAVV